jgi:hypothetical protein
MSWVQKLLNKILCQLLQNRRCCYLQFFHSDCNIIYTTVITWQQPGDVCFTQTSLKHTYIHGCKTSPLGSQAVVTFQPCPSTQHTYNAAPLALFTSCNQCLSLQLRHLMSMRLYKISDLLFCKLHDLQIVAPCINIPRSAWEHAGMV